jgi:hypothetical protein
MNNFNCSVAMNSVFCKFTPTQRMALSLVYLQATELIAIRLVVRLFFFFFIF